MRGRNKLTLNPDEMCRAVQCYLDRILTLGEQVEVVAVCEITDDEGYAQFTIDIVEAEGKSNATK